MGLAPFKDWDSYQLPIIWYKGEFDWNHLYALIRIWLESNGYKYDEKKYKHKEDEIEVKMSGKRKIDEMFRWNTEIEAKAEGYSTFEKIVDGKKRTMCEGRIWIRISSSVEFDYKKKFDMSNFTKMLREWIVKIRFKEIQANHLESFTYELYDLHHQIKIFLNMTTDTNAFTP